MLLTTAINYTNGDPHIGHCYEAVLADFLARFYRAFGSRTESSLFFQTGTDEHGQKIADRAAERGLTPLQMCDHYAAKFQSLAKVLELSHDHFIRTTDHYHESKVKQIFKELLEKGDIYLDVYEGWYNVREETFVTDREARQTCHKDPVANTPLKRISEPSYFFRLTKYLPAVLEHIKTHEHFILPEVHSRSILQRLQDSLTSEDPEKQMRDLSISRTTFDWGIPVPEDPDHCLYVWMDALFNYYTGPLEVLGPEKTDQLMAAGTIHVIGKDILWFHAVIWPALLMALGKPLPQTIWTHDFVSDAQGRKMSKSLGNVVEPTAILQKHGVDATRFYLLKETSLGLDLRFSEDNLLQAKKTELAAKLGNLVNRVLNIAKKYGNSIVPEEEAQPIFDINKLESEIWDCLKQCRVAKIVELIQAAIRAVNQDIVLTEIWKLPKKGTPESTPEVKSRKQRLIRTYLESLMIIAKLWAPINPTISEKIFAALGKSEDAFRDRLLPEKYWAELQPGEEVLGKLILFPL